MGVPLFAVFLACSQPTSTTPPPPPPPSSGPSLQFIAGATGTDTIQSRANQALVVEVHGQNGRPTARLVVRFETAPTNSPAVMYVANLSSNQFGLLATDTTKDDGHASVLVAYGIHPGQARVRVRVPELGLVDSVFFTILSGTAVRTVLAPHDTGVILGHHMTYRGAVVDRFGNPRPDSVRYRSLSPEISLTANVLTGQSFGLGRIELAGSGFADTGAVAVLPSGVLAAFSSGTLVMFSTDGTGLQDVVTAYGNAASWSPDGQQVVAEQPGLGGLIISDLHGHAHLLTSTDSVTYQEAPQFSHDGQWVYFHGDDVAGASSLYRVKTDGTGLQRISVIPAIEGRMPSPSPDGTRVLTGTFGGPFYMVDLASGTSTMIPATGYFARWAPQGDRIAFVQSTSPATDGFGLLSIMNPDGSQVRNVGAPNVTYYGTVDWSPDGQWIVAHPNLTRTIHLANPDLGIVLTIPAAFDWQSPTWKPR